MFDYYEPVPKQECPWCGGPFRVWQGKDGPNALVVWRQGHRHPVEQRVVEESRVDVTQFVLPDVFGITGWCENDHMTGASCRCRDGVWQEMSLDEDDLRRAEEQQERDRIQRLRESWRRSPPE